MPQLQDIERLVIAPAGEYLTLFEQVKKYVTKRAHKLLDYDRHREAVKKLKEKKDRTASDEKKLSQAEGLLDDATREYNNYNNLLKRELAIFVDLRIEFIDPCFATFYYCQVKVYQILHAEYKRLVSQGNFDMSCSAMNGFITKKDDIENLLLELTIPRKRGSKTDSVASDQNTLGAASSTDGGQTSPNSTSGQANLTSGASTVSPSGSSMKSTSPASVNPVPSVAAASAMGGVALPSLAKASPSPAKQYVVALYDFEAQADGDLSFKRDDKIEVIEKTADQNDWWTGRLNGKTGQFPGNYVATI